MNVGPHKVDNNDCSQKLIQIKLDESPPWRTRVVSFDFIAVLQKSSTSSVLILYWKIVIQL